MAVTETGPAPAPKPVREAGPARTGMQWLEIIILAIVLIGLILLFAKGISTSAKGDAPQCARQRDPRSRVGMLLALGGLSVFASGRAVAKARRGTPRAPAVTDSKVVRTDGF